jgi:hypothetical protein
VCPLFSYTGCRSCRGGGAPASCRGIFRSSIVNSQHLIIASNEVHNVIRRFALVHLSRWAFIGLQNRETGKIPRVDATREHGTPFARSPGHEGRRAAVYRLPWSSSVREPVDGVQIAIVTLKGGQNKRLTFKLIIHDFFSQCT